MQNNSTAQTLLSIQDLCVNIESGPILKGVTLTVNPGEIHAIMGPNGSGKSTLAKVIAGHPGYEITSGSIKYQGEDLSSLAPDERSRKGVFLAFQYPQEIPGVSILNFLRTAVNARREKDMPVLEFRKLMYEKMDELGMDRAFAARFINDGFSGGEKKRNEILQMSLLEPKLAVLDETDSGLDVDALRIVSHGVNTIMSKAKEKPGIVIITHYNRILDYIKPDVVHVLHQGKIVKSGPATLATELEERGYEWVANG